MKANDIVKSALNLFNYQRWEREWKIKFKARLTCELEMGGKGWGERPSQNLIFVNNQLGPGIINFPHEEGIKVRHGNLRTLPCFFYNATDNSTDRCGFFFQLTETQVVTRSFSFFFEYHTCTLITYALSDFFRVFSLLHYFYLRRRLSFFPFEIFILFQNQKV